MSTVTIRPNADDTIEWYAGNYTDVDDDITYPTNPTGEGDAIWAWAAAADDNQVDIFEFDITPSNLDVVTEIKIYAFGWKSTNNSGYPEVSYSINGGSSWSSETDMTSLGTSSLEIIADGAWHTVTVSSLSWTKAEIDQLQVRIRADVQDNFGVFGYNKIYALQVLVTYDRVTTTTTIRPNETFAWAWGLIEGNHTVIDDAITYPTTPTGENDRAEADGYLSADNNTYIQFGFNDLPGNLEVVTEIKIYLYGSIDDDGGANNFPEVSYSIDGGSGWSGDYNCTSFPQTAVNTIATAAWQTITVSSLSWTKAQIDAFRVRVRADVPDGDKTTISRNSIWAVQTLVTYIETLGWEGTLMGISNPQKFMGIDREDIEKIMGI